MTESKYLIIGNGVAGITAAQEIRQADPTGRILIVGDEAEPYYYRASLSEWISGQITERMLTGRTAEFYEQLQIEQLHGFVERVDAERKEVQLASGELIGYEKLLIASGARANIYPVEGLEELMVFRTLADAREIKERLGSCGRPLIVGGGILGLELAGALHKMGLSQLGLVQRSAPIGQTVT